MRKRDGSGARRAEWGERTRFAGRRWQTQVRRGRPASLSEARGAPDEVLRGGWRRITAGAVARRMGARPDTPGKQRRRAFGAEMTKNVSLVSCAVNALCATRRTPTAWHVRRRLLPLAERKLFRCGDLRWTATRHDQGCCKFRTHTDCFPQMVHHILFPAGKSAGKFAVG